MKYAELVQSSFFFGALIMVLYVMWKIWAPFLVAVALAGIIVTVSYPLHRRILQITPWQNKALGAGLSTLVVFTIIVIPILAASSVLVHEFISLYSLIAASESDGQGLIESLVSVIQGYVPGFELDVRHQMEQTLTWFSGNLGGIFSSTVSVALTALVAFLGTFYLFRDGQSFVRWITAISPLPDTEDKLILGRVAVSVRSVVTGTVLVSIIQGASIAAGFALFGIDRAILWGSIAALGSLLPGIGTTVIIVPAVAWLFFTSTTFNAVGLLIWGAAMLVIVDNLVSPYLMSRGNKLHPFVVLVSVLGGISLFGPIGFILGPVFASLLLVLLELYTNTLKRSTENEN